MNPHEFIRQGHADRWGCAGREATGRPGLSVVSRARPWPAIVPFGRLVGGGAVRNKKSNPTASLCLVLRAAPPGLTQEPCRSRRREL